MALFDLFKIQPSEPAEEVIQAACDLFGLSPENVSSVHSEKLDVLSEALWIIKLNDSESAIVAYDPDEMEKPVAELWFDESS